jgi:hypothetical protein
LKLEVAEERQTVVRCGGVRVSSIELSRKSQVAGWVQGGDIVRPTGPEPAGIRVRVSSITQNRTTYTR